MPKTEEHGIYTHETLVAVRTSPCPDCCFRLTLRTLICLLSLCPFSASSCPLAPPADVLSAPSHGPRLLLSRSLSGGELLLDYLHGPVAAEAVAAAPLAAARLARAMCAAGEAHRGRVGGGSGATIAGETAAAAKAAKAASASAWQMVAAVAAGGDDGTAGMSAGDFYVSIKVGVGVRRWSELSALSFAPCSRVPRASTCLSHNNIQTRMNTKGPARSTCGSREDR